MDVITILKERRKELLLKKLNKLRKLAKDYRSSMDCYNNSIKLICNNLNRNNFSKASYFFNSSFNSYSYTEELSYKYDSYDYYSSLYKRTMAKIAKLESKLQKL